MLPPYLIQTDIRALAGACVTLRMIFRPLIGFKVTIKHDDSPKYALRRALVVTRTSTILDSVVEVNIGMATDAYRGYLSSHKVPYLLTPTVFTLVNAIPAMRQLHTIRLNNIILSKMYLHTILSAPYPTHLILIAVQLPKIIVFPPTKLRKLTLTMMSSWETVQPLISQLATSLEYLELKWCEFLPPFQLNLPSFPCLQELRHHTYIIRSTFPDKSQLNELLRLGSQVTHLHVSGHLRDEPVTACQETLQYLSTSFWMLSEDIFGTKPFPRLMYLSLKFSAYIDRADLLFIHSSFIRDHFPTITSLELSIPCVFRNRAMVMARSQHKLQALKLIMYIQDWVEPADEEMDPFFPVGVPNDPLHRAMSPAPLQTLNLDVQLHGELEWNATRCIQWVFDDVVPSGGAGLKRISLLVSRSKSGSVEKERVLSRQWVKAPNSDWRNLE
jgi:hypothetical protein